MTQNIRRKVQGLRGGVGHCVVCVALSFLYSHVIILAILRSRYFTDDGLIFRRPCSL